LSEQFLGVVPRERLRDSLLERLILLAASARRAGLDVSIEQLATLVRGLGAMAQGESPALGRPALKRLVGLTLGVCEDDVALLGLLIDALFQAPQADPGAEQSEDPQPSVRERLQDALRTGDIAAGAQVGVMIAELADGARDPTGRGRLVQRLLRALDLSAMLSQALSDSPDADPLHRRLSRIGMEATLGSMESALQAELLRRDVMARADAMDRLSPVDVTGLLDGLAEIPLSSARRDDQERLQAAVRPLATRVAARARRRRGARRQLDVRRTLRRSIATGGIPMELRFRRHRPRRPQIVVLADVSGSLVDYASFTMGLLQALHDELPGLRCFAFVDGVGEVTDELLRRPAILGAQLPMIPGVVSGDGHSDYRRALEAFERLSVSLLTPTTSFVLLGDGRTRAPDPGEDVLRRLGHRVRRLYWLTPEPEAQWGHGDCRLGSYRRWCHRVDTVGTLGQLEAWVDRVIRELP
jgi:hypothetical protein